MGPEQTALIYKGHYERHKKRIAELEAALRPFAAAARRSAQSDQHHKITRADDESVGVVVDAGALRQAALALESDSQ